MIQIAEVKSRLLAAGFYIEVGELDNTEVYTVYKVAPDGTRVYYARQVPAQFLLKISI